LRRRSIQNKRSNNSKRSIAAEIHHQSVGFGFGGGGGCVGVTTGPTTGGSVGVAGGFGFTSGLGGGSGVRLVSGSFGGYFGGFGPGPSPNTAIALSNDKTTMLSQISDLWVECAFMGVLLFFVSGLVSRTFVFNRNVFAGEFVS
jgi:hypothetical protein